MADADKASVNVTADAAATRVMPRPLLVATRLLVARAALARSPGLAALFPGPFPGVLLVLIPASFGRPDTA
jgi:hypothetical protein